MTGCHRSARCPSPLSISSRPPSGTAYAALSVNRIVAAAGISRGSFDRYFRDKEDIVAYLMAEYQEQLGQRVKADREANRSDPFTWFAELSDFTAAFAGERPGACPRVSTDRERYRARLELLRKGLGKPEDERDQKA